MEGEFVVAFELLGNTFDEIGVGRVEKINNLSPDDAILLPSTK